MKQPEIKERRTQEKMKKMKEKTKTEEQKRIKSQNQNQKKGKKKKENLQLITLIKDDQEGRRSLETPSPTHLQALNLDELNYFYVNIPPLLIYHTYKLMWRLKERRGKEGGRRGRRRLKKGERELVYGGQ